jgi:hypothetical protein
MLALALAALGRHHLLRQRRRRPAGQRCRVIEKVRGVRWHVWPGPRACAVTMLALAASGRHHLLKRHRRPVARAQGGAGEAYSRAFFEMVRSSRRTRQSLRIGDLSRRPGGINRVPGCTPGTESPLEPAWMLGLRKTRWYVPASRQKMTVCTPGRASNRCGYRRRHASWQRPPGLGSSLRRLTEGNSGPVETLADE